MRSKGLRLGVGNGVELVLQAAIPEFHQQELQDRVVPKRWGDSVKMQRRNRFGLLSSTR